MMTKKLQDAINEQINAEMWSANLYLSMSFCMERQGLAGSAVWLKAQSNEELEHARMLADFVIKRGGVPEIKAISAVPTEWENALKLFEHVYQHECHVSELINVLVDVAAAEKDKAAQDFLWGFVREQVEEEATANAIIDKFKLAGATGLLFVDSQLGQRK